MHRLLFATFLIACEPFGPGGATPDPPVGGRGELYIEIDQLDFGDISVLQDDVPELDFVVRNSGTGLLKVAGLNHTVGDSEAFTSDAPPLLELSPNESSRITIRFSPKSSEDYTATLFPNGEKEIQLSGSGLAPKLQATPQELEFDSQAVGCNQQHQLLFTNTGEESLELAEIAISGSPAFVVDSEVPTVLAPDESSSSILVFSPSTGGMHSSVLSVESNDPLNPTTVFSLQALGYEGERVSEQYEYNPTGRSDFLLVLNERTSVRNHLASSTEVVEQFLTDLENVDWRIAVSNMSQSCSIGVDPWIDSSGTLENNTAALLNALIETGLGGTELFDKATLLLERTDEGDCLEGFLREESLLQIVFISDQTEGSLGSVDSHIQAMTSQLHSSQELAISSFSGRGTSSCLNSPRLIDAAEDTNGTQLDICADDFANFLAELSETATHQIDNTVSIGLAEFPVVSTLEVTHEGQALHSWQYISSDNKIILDGDANDLQENDDIRIEYLSAVVCD